MPALDRPTETAVDELARRARAAGLAPHAAEALALDCVLTLRAQGWRPTAARAAEEWRALTHERYRLIDQWLAEAREELDQARAAEVRSPLDQARAAAEVRALLDQITHRTGDHR